MKWIVVIAALIGAAVVGAVLHRGNLMQAAIWQHQVSPGPLSTAHASLENKCTECHTPVKGVEAGNCVVCHASNLALLQSQPTAFHADIQTCNGCHIEHQSENRRPTNMDHLALAKFGLRDLKGNSANNAARDARTRLLGWIKQHRAAEGPLMEHQDITPEEMILDCASCHANQDRHMKLFGPDCAQCHATAQWTIAQFQHPSPRSTDCAQCHQAPASHYMMHFEMVSKTVARNANTPGNPCCDDVQVNQCYRCHQTNSWNDIKGRGWYKHH